MSSEQLGSETGSLLEGTLLRHLLDDDFGVASAAAQCDLSVISDISSLLSALQQLMTIAMERLSHGDTVAQRTAFRIVDYLSVECSPQTVDQDELICFLLLEYLFPYCTSHVSVSLRIGSRLPNLRYPVARVLAPQMCLSHFDSDKCSAADLNQ